MWKLLIGRIGIACFFGTFVLVFFSREAAAVCVCLCFILMPLAMLIGVATNDRAGSQGSPVAAVAVMLFGMFLLGLCVHKFIIRREGAGTPAPSVTFFPSARRHAPGWGVP